MISEKQKSGNNIIPPPKSKETYSVKLGEETFQLSSNTKYLFSMLVNKDDAMKVFDNIQEKKTTSSQPYEQTMKDMGKILEKHNGVSSDDIKKYLKEKFKIDY